MDLEQAHGASSSRIAWLDALRGIALFSIVLGHFTELAGDFYLFVFSFHIQLFFFISGIFADRRGASFRELCKAIIQKLLLPYFALAALNLILFAVRDGCGPVKSAQMALDILLARRNYIFSQNLWFFPCLIVMSLLYWALKKLFRNRWLLLAVCLTLSLAMRIVKEEPQWIWSADSAILYLFYYALGDCAAPYLKRFDYAALARRQKARVGVLSALALALSGVWYLGYANLSAALGLSLSVTAEKLLRFFMALILIYAAAVVAYLLRRADGLCRIGRSTFIIAATEQITRLILLSCFELFGIQLALSSQFKALISTGIVLFCSYHIFAKPLKKCFPRLFGVV